MFASVTDALAFVRFRRVVAAEFRSDFADKMLVRTFNGDLGVFFHGDLDLIGNFVIDRMGETQRQVDHLAGDGSLEADALDFQFFHETVRDPLDHVVEQGAAEAVQRFGLGIFPGAADNDLVTFHLERGACRQGPVQLALRPFDVNFLPLHFHLYFGGNDNRLFSNT